MAAPKVESCCARCQRKNPEAATGGLPGEWEVFTDDRGEVAGLICDGCMTREEWADIADEYSEFVDGIEREED